MINFPNAKINLGLSIIDKRDDGYHDIESLIVPINLYDVLEIIENKENCEDILFTSSGFPIDVDAKKNLVVRAINLLKQDYRLPPLKVHLHKHIPMGAGLGGGSSDAAFALKLINEMFDLSLSCNTLEGYARQLGSDCALFINNQPVIVKGRGDVLEPAVFNINDYEIKLIHPRIHISTAEAYANIIPHKPEIAVSTIIKQPISTWKEELFNDFETFAFAQYPELKNIKDQLYAQGAVYAAMSGSGSSIFGIFPR